MAHQDPGPPPVDFELDTYQLVVFRVGERAAEYTREAAEPILAEHIRQAIQLREAGILLGAGAITGSAADPPLTGLAFFTIPPDEIRRRIADDPAITSGLEAIEVVEFRCPKGSLVFGNARPAPQGPGGPAVEPGQ
jgi:hypothetical protein